ncbi:cytochrome P450 [Streptomyces sp. NPDC047130]|uniref:cytochrome P450 family protein n=1 Tax=Streptomyces sp. NPDC047130 TaxID=3155261 RepID=UPI0033E4DB47
MTSPPDQGCPALDTSGLSLHAQASQLRSSGPAVRVTLPGGVIAWAVTRHEVIKRLAADARISRDPVRHWPGRLDVPDGWPLAAVTFQQNFFNAYGSEHRTLRGRVAPSFSPRRVAAMRPLIRRTAEQLARRLAASRPGTVVDLRGAFALPLTMTVICDLFGVPDAQRQSLGTAIDGAANTSLGPEESRAVQADIAARLDELVAYKRAHPGPDLTSDLLIPAEGEQVLTEETLKGTLFLMIGAGFETTVHLITSAVHAVLSEPAHLSELRSGKVGWPDIVEETLRHEGPIMYLPLRYAVADVDLGEGVVVRQGEPVLFGFAAAGRDPQRHPEEADRFDPLRADKGHLAFGFGPHFCLGAHLARTEAETALEVLFSHLPRLSLADPDAVPERLPTFILNGLGRLPVVPLPAAGAAGGAPT